jgi:hypothetical protein
MYRHLPWGGEKVGIGMTDIGAVLPSLVYENGKAPPSFIFFKIFTCTVQRKRPLGMLRISSNIYMPVCLSSASSRGRQYPIPTRPADNRHSIHRLPSRTKMRETRTVQRGSSVGYWTKLRVLTTENKCKLTFLHVYLRRSRNSILLNNFVSWFIYLSVFNFSPSNDN